MAENKCPGCGCGFPHRIIRRRGWEYAECGRRWHPQHGWADWMPSGCLDRQLSAVTRRFTKLRDWVRAVRPQWERAWRTEGEAHAAGYNEAAAERDAAVKLEAAAVEQHKAAVERERKLRAIVEREMTKHWDLAACTCPLCQDGRAADCHPQQVYLNRKAASARPAKGEEKK